MRVTGSCVDGAKQFDSVPIRLRFAGIAGPEMSCLVAVVNYWHSNVPFQGRCDGPKLHQRMVEGCCLLE